MSLFITFEGLDGSGKSTQAEMLYKTLQTVGAPAVLTREPGGTPLGDRISDLLKWSRGIEITPVGELLLFNASRAQLVEKVIEPALASGKVVVCDRFTDSTVAYQAFGRGLPMNTVQDINQAATGGLKPHLTILVDVPVEVGISRKRNDKKDRFEEENLAFHERVRNGYLKLAEAEPRRFLVVDGTQGREDIARIIWEWVKAMLPARGQRV